MHLLTSDAGRNERADLTLDANHLTMV